MILWACSCLWTGMDWLIFFLLLFGGHGNLELCENKLRFGHLPVSRLNATLTPVARVAERVHCLCIYSNLLWFQRLKCINSHWNWIWLWILVVWPPVVERLLLLLIHHDWSHNITQQNKTKQNNKKNSLFWCLLGNNSPLFPVFLYFVNGMFARHLDGIGGFYQIEWRLLCISYLLSSIYIYSPLAFCLLSNWSELNSCSVNLWTHRIWCVSFNDIQPNGK